MQQRKEWAMKEYCDGGEAILQAFRSLGVDYFVVSSTYQAILTIGR
jgi:hypothetical protein